MIRTRDFGPFLLVRVDGKMGPGPWHGLPAQQCRHSLKDKWEHRVQRHESGPEGAAGPQEPLLVFILDDHELVRPGLKDLHEGEGFEVVGESGSAAEATRRIPALQPDIAILDGRLPDGTGIEVCRDVRSLDPRLHCLILTSYDDEQAIRTAITQVQLSIPVSGGRPVLGTWQGVYLFEHRRAPHRREVALHLIGE